jgi:hypothetical protein
VIEATGNANAGDVLIGKSFSKSGQADITGTMANNGAVVITPTTTDQAIAAGYHNGLGLVSGDANLISGNIKSGVTLFGVAGDPNVVNTSSGDATAADIRSGKKAWVGGNLVTGAVAEGSNVSGANGATVFSIPDGFYSGKTCTANDSNLVASKIISGVTIFGVTGIYSFAPVPKTGQTISYAVGDDGDLEKGVAWPIPRFITSTAGIVTDTLTGLIWLQNANCFGLRTSPQALSDVNGLASGSCGLMDGSVAGDWRLPNVRELQSLIDYGQHSPNLGPGHPFTSVQLSIYYWSSTAPARVTPYNWCVDFRDGYVAWSDPATPHYVWPVRGGQ